MLNKYIDLVKLPHLTEEEPSPKEGMWKVNSWGQNQTLDCPSFLSPIIILVSMLIAHVILKNLAALDTELKTKPHLFHLQFQLGQEGKVYYLKLLNKYKTKHQILLPSE